MNRTSQKKPGAIVHGSPAVLTKYAKTRDFPPPTHERFGFIVTIIYIIQSCRAECQSFIYCLNQNRLFRSYPFQS